MTSHTLPILLVFLLCLAILPYVGMTGDTRIPILGTVKYIDHKQEYVEVDFGNQIGSNNLFLAGNVQVWYIDSWLGYDDPVFNEKIRDLHFGLLRTWVYIYAWDWTWDESTQTGYYNWNALDKIIGWMRRYGDVSICLVGSNRWLPPGMESDYQGTGFPNPESLGKWAADIVYHINIEKGYGVKYWEVYDDVGSKIAYYADKVANYAVVFGRVAEYIHNVDPDALVGCDGFNNGAFLDYFASNVQGVGFLGYHKWACWTDVPGQSGYFDNDECMSIADRLTKNGGLEPKEFRQRWYDKTGQWLPVLNLETGLNAAKGDSRNYTPFGAAFYAELLRAQILDGSPAYSVFFRTFMNPEPSSESYWDLLEGGNPPDYAVHYQYWANYLFGNYLSMGDVVYSSSSSSFTALSSLAWKNSAYYNILLIGKKDIVTDVEVQINGVGAMTNAMIFKIDKNLNGIQALTNAYSNPLHVTLYGYAVVLIQLPA